MNRPLRASALLGAVCCMLACGNDATPGAAAAGAAGMATGGAGASSGGGSTAGTSGSPSTAAGSGGQNTSGGGNAGGAGAGNAGSANVGGAGTGGSAGAGGNAGASGSAGGSGGAGGNLPKRVLLYYFSTFAIGTVDAQLTFYKNQLTTWGYEVDESKLPDDISTTNLARYGGVGMINNCFEPFGAGKPGDTQAAALKAFVQGGGGLFGTHCADVTFTSAATMPAYNQLLGGWAHASKDSGDNGSLTCTKKADHPTSMQLPATFTYTGNVDVADVAADATVLVECKFGNTTTPVSWVRTETGGGRVFYTSFAKVDADLTNATIGTNHIVAGLGWVLGR